MSYNCEICGFKTHTEGGMKLHIKVKHQINKPPEKTTTITPEVKVAKVTKQKEVTISDLDKALEEQKKNYYLMKKKWPKSPSSFSEGETVTRAEILKFFPSNATVRIVFEPLSGKILDELEPTYTVLKITELKNDWKQVSLLGSKNKISWKEGPYKKGYYVGMPNIQRTG